MPSTSSRTSSRTSSPRDKRDKPCQCDKCIGKKPDDKNDKDGKIPVKKCETRKREKTVHKYQIERREQIINVVTHVKPERLNIVRYKTIWCPEKVCNRVIGCPPPCKQVWE